MKLIARAPECEAIDSLLDSVRGGLSGTLVIRGDAGIGKTALLDYAVDTAPDFLVVRFAGVEAESQLGFAALHRLLLPILHQVERLPAPQRDAMNSALGLAAAPPANRFLVGLGIISLAANAARAGGRLLTIIDDAQWIDRESLEALAFWGRRLHADRIALIFGERTGAETHGLLDDFPVVPLSRLDDAAALELLTREAGGMLDRDLAARIVAETEGNPLALVEMAKDLAPDELVGAAATPQPLPISRRLEERYLRQVRSLPEDSQQLLLLAAADSSADAGLLWRAAALLGVGPTAASAAEAAGLLSLGPRVSYRHPLIRSAVYGGAQPADRRAVHGALARATDAAAEPDRQAWHLSAATVGPDEEVAALLEGRAQHARARGRHTAEVALFTRAAELSIEPAAGAARRLQAAEAALDEGSPRQAHALVSMARDALRDPAMHARAERVEGLALLQEGEVALAGPKLLAAGVGFGDSDRGLGRATVLEAIQTACYSGYSANHEFMQAVAAAEAAQRGQGSDGTAVDFLLRAFAANARTGFRDAVPAFREAVRVMRAEVAAPDLVPWITLVSASALNIWDNAAHDALWRRTAAASREQGVLIPLATALSYGAYSETWAGRLDAASQLFAEASDVHAAAGVHFLPLMDLELDAFYGRDAAVEEKAKVAISLHEAMGLGGYALAARLALVVLHLGRCRYDEALRHALVLFEADPLQSQTHALSDLVEAAVRARNVDVAEAAVRRLDERARAAGSPWALGLLARAKALIADDDGEPLYQEAIDRLSSAGVAIEAARARLVYGEWLRRRKRRTDARDCLRHAIDSLDAMGVEAFAARARDELQATGERAR
ncbi:MAG: AAA family ATPase, partial [Acidimicrobiia bacterium]|nr:AAA family ATPase [Acidimicrobiia bacterium]